MKRPIVRCEYCGEGVYSINGREPLTDERSPYIDGKRACYKCYHKKSLEWHLEKYNKRKWNK